MRFVFQVKLLRVLNGRFGRIVKADVIEVTSKVKRVYMTVSFYKIKRVLFVCYFFTCLLYGKFIFMRGRMIRNGNYRFKLVTFCSVGQFKVATKRLGISGRRENLRMICSIDLLIEMCSEYSDIKHFYLQ